MLEEQVLFSRTVAYPEKGVDFFSHRDYPTFLICEVSGSGEFHRLALVAEAHGGKGVNVILAGQRKGQKQFTKIASVYKLQHTQDKRCSYKMGPSNMCATYYFSKLVVCFVIFEINQSVRGECSVTEHVHIYYDGVPREIFCENKNINKMQLVANPKGVTLFFFADGRLYHRNMNLGFLHLPEAEKSLGELFCINDTLNIDEKIMFYAPWHDENFVWVLVNNSESIFLLSMYMYDALPWDKKSISRKFKLELMIKVKAGDVSRITRSRATGLFTYNRGEEEPFHLMLGIGREGLILKKVQLRPGTGREHPTPRKA